MGLFFLGSNICSVFGGAARMFSHTQIWYWDRTLCKSFEPYIVFLNNIFWFISISVFLQYLVFVIKMILSAMWFLLICFSMMFQIIRLVNELFFFILDGMPWNLVFFYAIHSGQSWNLKTCMHLFWSSSTWSWIDSGLQELKLLNRLSIYLHCSSFFLDC